MPDISPFQLKIVDGLRLPIEVRNALQPGGTLRDAYGHARVLPRFFYEIPSWQAALELQLTPNFALWEFIHTDIREAEALRGFPRYIPCSVPMFAMVIQRFRDALRTPVHIAANGGYRSPQHALTCRASPHCWGAAADIFKIGESYLNTRETIEKYAALARELLPGVWTHPVGHGAEETDDHLHLDVGYMLTVPHKTRVDAAILGEASV